MKIQNTTKYAAIKGLKDAFKGDPSKEFFVMCGKCEKKIFEHKGFVEVDGKFTFAVKCPYCGDSRNHTVMTLRAQMKEQADKAMAMINPEMITKLTKKMMEGG